MVGKVKDKSWQKYINENSRRSMPVIRDKGMSVWSIIGYYRVYEGVRRGCWPITAGI